MQGVEISHMNAAIKAVLKSFYDFRNNTAGEALRPVARYGKKDTLGMDAGPEITICSELTQYDTGAVVITEEAGTKGSFFLGDSFRPNDPQTFRTVFISDPTDRSNQLKAFLNDCPQGMRIGDILNDPETVKAWQLKVSGPASISGATSAISCIRRGVPIFSVIVNYITQELYVSCGAGNRVIRLPDERPGRIDLAYIRERGQPVTFPSIGGNSDSMKRFVTFLGDTGKAGYNENFDDSKLMTDDDKGRFLHYGTPGGPSRVLYLSSLFVEAPASDKPIGFVLANGEKIGEWVHWLSFVQHAKNVHDESQPALILFEVFQERPWTKEGILMSTPPDYSVFHEYGGRMFIDTSRLLRMSNPSKLRSTLIVAPYDNRWVVSSSSQSGYRPIRF